MTLAHVWEINIVEGNFRFNTIPVVFRCINIKTKTHIFTTMRQGNPTSYNVFAFMKKLSSI